MHPHPTQHCIDVLVPVADELSPVTLPAVHPLPAVTILCGQQILQQGTAQLGHRGPYRQLDRAHILPGAAAGHREGRQPCYLGGELRLDLGGEPPFSPSGSAGGAGTDAPGGRASQIASFTSTI